MKLKLPRVFGQKESAWKDKKLGTSTVTTIGSNGCLLSDIASVCCYHDKDTDPARLNDNLVKKNGFYQGNRLIYGTISDIYPDITVDWTRYIDCPDTPAPLDVIYQTLNEGLIPLLKVDASPTAGLQEHWIKAIGYDDTTREFLVFDPWDKAEYWFRAKYGDPATKIFKIVVYKGPVVVEEEHYTVNYKGQVLATYETNPIDKISQLDKELQGCRENLAQEIQNNATLQASLTQQEKDNAELITARQAVEKERDNAKSELKEVQGWAKDILGIEPCVASNFRAVSRALQRLTDENNDLKEKLEQVEQKYKVLFRVGKYYICITK